MSESMTDSLNKQNAFKIAIKQENVCFTATEDRELIGRGIH